MMAAGRAAELGGDVVLLEKMRRLGTKLRITGKGRCNITNAGGLDEFIACYGRNGKFLYGPFSHFFNDDLIAFFGSRGVETVVERGRRVFPCSSRADEVADCLAGYLREQGVRTKTSWPVRRITMGKGRVAAVEGPRGELPAAAVIIATGGASYPRTGSSGDGYELASALGHAIVSPKPALVPLEVVQDCVRDMDGLKLKNVELSVDAGGRRRGRMFGEMAFTGFGVTGPIVLSMSGDIVSLTERGEVRLSINFKPALSRQQLEARLLREFSGNARSEFRNILPRLLPRKAVPVFLRLSGVAGARRGADITRAERGKLLDLLVHFRLTVRGPRPMDEAIVTRGGVALGDIDPREMASRKIRGLFFCGEVIDIDGVTGGYNLQAAFSTGYAAGEGAGRFALRDS